jgi:hypothetical protein
MLRSTITLLFGALMLVGFARAAPVAFDTPVRTETVELKASPYAQPQRITCYVFPQFTLKARQWGVASEASFSLIPGAPGPACGDVVRGEHRYIYYGGFTGVKGIFVVLNSRDGHSDCLSVLDGKSGRALLSNCMAGAWSSAWFTADSFVFTYRRVFTSDCPLRYGSATQCWTDIKQATGLRDGMEPDCRGLYEDRRKKIKFASDLKFLDRTPVKITYNARVRYAGGKLDYVALPGPVECALAY